MHMPLSTTSCTAAPALGFLDGLTLARARAHEFCGPARRSLALFVARALSGPVIWIVPAHARDRLHGQGVASLIDPGRLLLVAPRRPEDLLWSMEESLRAGCSPLVLCELPAPPGLTPVRRLHLAAETAVREKGQHPLGLLLIPGDGGAPGVESRWHLSPTRSGWRLERRRARTQPPMAWDISAEAEKGEIGKIVPTPRQDVVNLRHF